MKYILITGIGGYIGSNLAASLNALCGIRGIGYATRFNELRMLLPPSVHLIEGDITDEVAMSNAAKGVDVIIHTAGHVSERFCSQYPKEAQQSIVNGSLVAAKVAQAEGALFMHLSSFAVYSSYQKRSLPLHETDALLPDSAYGKLKAQAEKEIAPYSPLILRLAHVYGMQGGLLPREKKIIDMFAEMAHQQQSLTVYNKGREQLDLVHIGDVARLIAQIIATPPPLPLVWNVGSGGMASVMDIATLVQKEYFALTKCHVALHFVSESSKKEKPPRWISLEKVRAFAPWFPGISLQEGIRRMLEYKLQ